MEFAINYWAVLIAAIAGFGIGGLWYSPVLFQKRWMRLSGVSMEGQYGKGLSAGQAMAIEFVMILIASYVLAHFVELAGAYSATLALQLGFWLWLGFQMPMLLASVLFEHRPFQLFVLNSLQRLAAILLMALILGLWA